MLWGNFISISLFKEHNIKKKKKKSLTIPPHWNPAILLINFVINQLRSSDLLD